MKYMSHSNWVSSNFTGDGNVSFEEFVDILSNMTDATAESSAGE